MASEKSKGHHPSVLLPPSEANGFPFFSWAGLRITHAKDGEAQIELDVAHHHRGGGGTEAVNGGIVAYMFDGLLGVAVRSVWEEDVVGQVTVNLNIQYRQMLHAKQVVIGKSRVTTRGRSTVFAEGEVYNDAGQVAASCTGIFRLFRERRAKT